MQVSVSNGVVEVLRGDITKQETDAVVNAANKRLAPGGGVAGAIHRAAGDQLWEECKELGGCETGEAKITKGHDLPAGYIVHTVGPVYSGSDEDAELLAASYFNSLRVADENKLSSVSFPALSTGAFGYPIEQAAEIAMSTVAGYLRRYPQSNLKLIRFVLFDKASEQVHCEALSRVAEEQN